MPFLLMLMLAASAAAASPSEPGADSSDSRPIPGEIPITARSPEAIASFRDGRRKVINWDCPSGAVLLKKALAIEPDFPLALAWLGSCETTPDGLQMIERAVQLAKTLPATERMTIETLAAQKHGDDELVRKLRRGLVDLAPNDWLAQFYLGVQSQYDHKYQAAILHLKRAIDLNPQLAEAYNYLGYVYAEQGMGEEGVAAARKFIELRPAEANAHDSLGEVFLLLNRFEEAEVEFHTALEMTPDFWMSSAGLAYERFYRGDFAGGREAIAKARKIPHAELDARALLLVDAWALLAVGRSDEALAELDGLEKDALARKSPLGIAWARFERAEMQIELDRLAEAKAQMAASRQALEGAGEGDGPNRLRRALLVLDAVMGARSEKPALAQASVAALREEMRRSPSNTDVRSALHHAEGEAALAAHDPAGAVAPFQLCPNSEVACRLDLARAQDESDQPRAAEETRAHMLSMGLRDNLHRGEDPSALYVRLKMTRK